MEIVDIQEHLGCFNYDRSDRPRIEIIVFEAGHSREVEITANEIVFFIEGCIGFSFRDYPWRENSAGQLIFLPCGGKASLTAIRSSEIIVFRMDHPVGLCENWSMEQLYISGRSRTALRMEDSIIGTLHIDEDIRRFLEGVSYHVGRGLKCKRFFDLKISEFFLLLRINYTKRQVREFFSPILSPDTAFSEHVRRNWGKYTSVGEMAESMNMSVKQFSSKFKTVFNQTAYNWMKQSRAGLIQREIKVSAKPLKQIARELGFNTVHQFTNFCKKELGCTPSEIRKGEKIN